MVTDIKLTFCTYFKSIQRFVYEQETYEDFVAFCVKRGAFSYQIGNEKQAVVGEGEIVICPPHNPFYRKIIQPTELCMIKFRTAEPANLFGKKIRVSNLLRFNENLSKLESCLFCDTLAEEPLFSHYCMDVLYLALDSVGENGKLSGSTPSLSVQTKRSAFSYMSVDLSPAPEIISGVRASSIRMESTSSTIAKLCPRCTMFF